MKRETPYSAMWVFVCILMVIVFSAYPERGEGEDRCLSCHGKKDLTTVGEGIRTSLVIDVSEIAKSVHSNSRCTSCHEDAAEVPHRKGLHRVRCGVCHEDEEKTYRGSSHGLAWKEGEDHVPGCTTCHGDHDILPVNNPRSKVFSLNIVDICLGCHEDVKVESEHALLGVEHFKAYRESVHGRAIRRAGLNVAAVCPDCHGNHKILPADDPESKVNRLKIPSDCGKCHMGIQEEYDRSIHGTGLRAGIAESPVCTDCHGEHNIAKITDATAKVYVKNIPKTCGECHESEAISSRYALPKKRFSTYMDSFHGIALEFGMTKTANCASCHGYHLILPSANPKSPIHSDNIPGTCGKCHPRSSTNFAKGKVHVEVSKKGHIGVWIVRVFYTLFIAAFCVLFVLHITFDFVARGRRKQREKG